jgi:hypothetical protein
MLLTIAIFIIGAILGGLLGYGYGVEDNHRHYLKGYADGYHEGKSYWRPKRLLRSVRSA